MNFRRSIATVGVAGALVTGGLALASPAQAQPVVTGGLINITLVDVLNENEVAVQIPIGVAVNICGVNAAALFAIVADDGDVRCEGTVEQLPRAFR